MCINKLQACDKLYLFHQQLLTTHFSTFLAKVFATVDPGATYLPGWHIDLIAEYLHAAEQGEITRLIINMPPRALKSITTSVAWPAWLLGHNPSRRIITASYSSNLSTKHSVDTRLVMQQPWYQECYPNTRLSNDQNEKHKFTTTSRGYRMATSVGGTLTGEGGNFLIVDDPLSAAQGQNKAARDYANSWFKHTFATRLDDKRSGVIILVMQRLHAEDLTAFLLGMGGWEHLCLPAIAETRTIHTIGKKTIIREVDDLLHPSREDAELIDRAKRELGSNAFVAQYQQNPLPPESEIVKKWWIKRYDTKPWACKTQCNAIIQSWDTAIKASNHHDASVCLTFGQMQNSKGEEVHYLLDAVVMRAEYPELRRAFLSQAEKWQPDGILIEDKASGQQLLQDMRKETKLSLIACKPSKDKAMRLQTAALTMEAGRFALPEEAPWLFALEEELFHFPNHPHDDQVDALTQYLNWARSKEGHTMQVRWL